MRGLVMVGVLPRDLLLYGDEQATDWIWTASSNASLDPAATTQVFLGARSLAVQKTNTRATPWKITLRPASPRSPYGYTKLHFAFCLAEATDQSLLLRLNSLRNLDLKEGWKLDWTSTAWQTVDVPLDSLGVAAATSIESLQISV
jgi:hypothetical protein